MSTFPSELVITCPANGSPVGTAAITPRAELPAILARARAAQPAWAARSVSERAEALLKVRDHVLRRMDDVVDLVMKEVGKPRPEALLHEILDHFEVLAYFCGRAEEILAPLPIPMRLLKHRASYVHYVPRGVVAVIGPWNFPVGNAFSGVAMGLLAGNAVVLKPSEFTPLCARLVHSLYLEAGIPADLFQIVYGYGDVGAALIEAGPDLVEFIGSVNTGKKVAHLCAERLIPCTLELGGKAPALVLADAPLERTLAGVVWGGLANAGQVCASVERVLVHDAIYERFVPQLVERVKALRQGDPTTSDEVEVGPLCNQRQLEIVEALVADAVAKGATVACGGKRGDPRGHYFEPTVLLGCTPEMDVVNKETFGPVLPVMRLPDEEAMIKEANRSHLGLLAYVFCKDAERGRRVAERVEAGTVMVNDVLASHAAAETPWGGLKQSGIGIIHSDEGLRHMCQARHVNYPVLPWLSRELWWYPYHGKDLPLMKRALQGLYGRGLTRFFRRAA